MGGGESPMASKVKSDIISTSGTHTLEYYDRSHRYLLDGKRVKSITGVGGAYPKGDPLTNWKIEEGAKYTFKECQEIVRKISKLAARTPQTYKDSLSDNKNRIIDEAKKAFTISTRKAAEVGSTIHDYAYALQTGKDELFEKSKKEIECHPNEALVLKAKEAVDEWWKQVTDHVLYKEAICASVILQIAGKFDRYVVRNNSYGVVDFKTSKRIMIDNFQQCAGYDLLIQEWYGYKAQFYEIVHFSKETGKLAIGTLDDNGYWLNGELIIGDTAMMAEQQLQFRRNVATKKYISKYDDFWKKGN